MSGTVLQIANTCVIVLEGVKELLRIHTSLSSPERIYLLFLDWRAYTQENKACMTYTYVNKTLCYSSDRRENWGPLGDVSVNTQQVVTKEGHGHMA